MGWTFGWTSKRELIHYLNSPLRLGTEIDVVAKCVRGNVLWTVREFKEARGGFSAGERYIGCDLLAGPNAHDSNWGYKDMCESVGPCYYTCPLKYLDMAPEVSTEWRQKVREYHARRSQPLKIDQVVRLVNASIPSVTITSLRPLMGRHNGRLYRIPRRMLAPPSNSVEGAVPGESAVATRLEAGSPAI